MNCRSQFPLSVATDEAFCNRTDELNKLQLFIEQQRPVLLVSPRRYGKTSLAIKAIEASQLPYAHIDLFSAVDEQDIERLVLKGVGQLISRIESLPQKALQLASDIFEGTHIRTALTKIGIEVEISRENTKKPAHRVLDILERLEKLALKVNKKIILFFDEFQCIREITTDHAMEAVFRQIAQLTRTVSFIFSGSNRHLLNELFEDRNRPFYKLCERITLDRIAADKYSPHIQQASKKRWGSALEDNVLALIFKHSKRHPYYLNLLCSRAFILDIKPTEKAIDELWSQYIMEERSNVASELDLLSKNQRKLLVILSRVEGTNEPLGQRFISAANISKATLDQSMKFLEKKDYIYKDEEGYFKVLDPLIEAVLQQ